MTLNETLTIAAILAGPISALWIQRILDARRETHRRRSEIFRIMWATRTIPQRLQHRHVEALNMIGVDFASNKPVIDAWKEYMDKLNSPEPEDENQKPQFYRERDSKFHNLIFAISQSLKYKFTRLEVEKQHYAPVAHGTWAEQEAVLRTGITRLFKGEFSLPIRITEDEAASKK